MVQWCPAVMCTCASGPLIRLQILHVRGLQGGLGHATDQASKTTSCPPQPSRPAAVAAAHGSSGKAYGSSSHRRRQWLAPPPNTPHREGVAWLISLLKMSSSGTCSRMQPCGQLVTYAAKWIKQAHAATYAHASSRHFARVGERGSHMRTQPRTHMHQAGKATSVCVSTGSHTCMQPCTPAVCASLRQGGQCVREHWTTYAYAAMYTSGVCITQARRPVCA